MHPTIMTPTLSNSFPETKPNRIVDRVVTPFKPSPWGDRFLDYTLDSKVIEAQQEVAKNLKEEVRRELLFIANKPLNEQLHQIDSIERLGVAYHFEEEIEDALQRIHKMSFTTSSNDLVFTSLQFRLLRQHGYKVSSDVFKGFICSNGSLKEELADDVPGMLSLYESCHVRIHGEDILDEVLPFLISNLTKFISEGLCNQTLEERIRHALQKPLHKRIIRVESIRYMKVYEEDYPLHNKALLKFAKVDFNLLQAFHKKELSDICRWWKSLDPCSKLPLRDRIVESFFWATAAYFEPQYSLARKICAYAAQVQTSMDDIYDVYGTLEELQIFTEAVERWDTSCLDQLPNVLRWFLQKMILEPHEEMERDLAPKGRSQYVDYVKEEKKAVCRTYMTEAVWRHKKYIPTLEEYMKNDMYRNIAYVEAIAYTFLANDMAHAKDFEWLRSLPKSVKASCHIIRILNDIGGKKFDEDRGLSSLMVESYMKEHGVTFEQACEKLYKKTDELWKDINEGMIMPTEVPMHVFKCCVLNMSRAVEVIYDGGEDGFTLVNQAMKQNVESLFVESIPM